MIDINDLKKIGQDILNFEGSILALYKDDLGEFYLHSFLNDGTGKVYYRTTEDFLNKFYESEITIRELFMLSLDLKVVIGSHFAKPIFVKKIDLIDKLHCGHLRFSEF